VDDDGFHDFVHAQLARLSRVAYLLTGDHHAAEDLLQSALARVAARWQRVRRADDPASYVRRILYHEHVSLWRRSGHLRREVPVEWMPEQRTPDGTDHALRRLMLADALARLTRSQRAVIVLRFFEDLSEADAALALGASVGTIKSQTRHALKRLRELAPELSDLVRDPPGVPV
jgi:RNA polymerase sigma-70 factor (sigma-E family)